MSAGVIHVINKFKVYRKNQAFQCLMIYQDLETKYCFVKPLLSKSDPEISIELVKIFTTCGAPDELHVNSCSQDLIESIVENIALLCPMFKINFIKKNGENNDLAMQVVKELHIWMDTTKKEEWEIGCCIVQNILNSEKDKATRLSPRDRFIKCKQADASSSQAYLALDLPECLNETTTVNIKNPISADQLSETHLSASSDNYLSETAVIPKTEKISPEKTPMKNRLIIEGECEDSKLNVQDKMLVFDGGIIFPGFNNTAAAEVEVKMERLDE